MPNTNKIFYLLTINPGSTSTKIGIFENEISRCEKNLQHSVAELERFEKIWDQYEFRKKEIIDFLAAERYDLKGFDAVVGRGGLVRPIESGTYRVDRKMIDDLRIGVQGHHASNLGGVLAYGIGWDFGIPSFIVDPVAVDEFDPLSRFSGMADIPRTSLFHALNVKATARKVALDKKKTLADLNFIVAHMGGGITVAAIRNGRIIEVNNGLSEGPFSPERSGAVPLLPLVEMCFSGKYDKKTVIKKIIGGGGLVSYLNTNNAREVEALIRAGNSKARLVFEAMAYQISAEIGARAVALAGRVDCIVLTGGLAHSRILTKWIEERVKFISKVVRYPGEDELEALALGGLRVLRGEEIAKMYYLGKKTIGIFYSEHLEVYDKVIQHLETHLKELGYRFRQRDENMEILTRNCQGDAHKMHEAIDEFQNREVSLILAIGSPALAAIKMHLKNLSVPVVCTACFDPIVMGLGESYAGSGNMVTGTCYRVEVKEQLEKALLPIVPKIERMGVIYKSGELQSEIQRDELESAAQIRGFEVFRFDIQDEDSYPEAAEFFQAHNVDAVFLVADTVTAGASEKDLEVLTKKFPTLGSLEAHVRKGCLVGRLADWDIFALKATGMIVSVLDGANPGSIPIYRNPEARTILNRDTAAHLGISYEGKFSDEDNVKFIGEENHAAEKRERKKSLHSKG